MRAVFLVTSLLFSSIYASNVIDLDPDNFDAHVFSGKPALVEFYAPWCGHCKNLAPIYEELADSFAKSKKKVVIAKVDADGAGKPLGSKYGVTGYPTLKWFDGTEAEPTPYEGGRDLDALSAFITQKTGLKGKGKPPPVTVQLDSSNFDSIVMDKSKDVLVAFTASWCGHCKAMKPAYEQTSIDFQSESSCVIANIEADAKQNSDLAKEYGIGSFPTLKFFPKGDKTPVDYNGGRTEADFVAFLNEKCGTSRAVGGSLNEKAGRLPDFDALASKFYSAASGARSSIYQEALALADTAGVYGKQYLKVMEKVVNGSEEYLVKESTRLSKILEKKTMAPSKLDEIKIRANILAAFAEQKVVAAQDAAAEVVDEVVEKANEVKETAEKMAEDAAKKIKEEL